MYIHLGGLHSVHFRTSAFGKETALGLYGLMSIIGKSLKAASPFSVCNPTDRSVISNTFMID